VNTTLSLGIHAVTTTSAATGGFICHTQWIGSKASSSSFLTDILKRSLHTDSVVKAQQHLFNLKRLKKFCP
jgi:hypothetical protein